MKRLLAILAAVVLALVAAGGAAIADTNSSASLAGGAQAPQRASLPDIEDEVMCPICGTTLQLSNSPQADRERALIRGLISAGKTKQEIKDALVAEYGNDVLATPDDSGFDLTAWIVPLLGLLAGLTVVAVALRHWRRSARRMPPDARPPEGEEAERLDADLARYDL